MSDVGSVPESVLAAAKIAESSLVPAKSKTSYQKQYDEFLSWKMAANVTEITETVMLAYFQGMSEKFKPTTLWSYYSMLKCKLKLTDNIDISKYYKLTGFLKNFSAGYIPVQAEVFKDEHISKFIFGAADSEWLDVKVACILGISGTLRTDELAGINCKDVEQHGDLFLVHIWETKTKYPRSFTIPVAFSGIVKKYAALRKPGTVDPRFFVNYRAGACTTQPIGKNKFSKMPQRIATFLEILEPERFTGHALRRTSASLLADSGAGMERIMRAGGWKSSKVAEGYVENSMKYKEQTGNMIASRITSRTTILSQSVAKVKASAANSVVAARNNGDGDTVMSQGYSQNVMDDTDIELQDLESIEATTRQVEMRSEGSHAIQMASGFPFKFDNCTVTIHMK